MEPELECFDAQTHKAAEFGELKGGFMVRCSLQMCRRYVNLSSGHPAFTFIYPLVQVTRPQTLSPALSWFAIPFRSSCRYKWEGVDQLAGDQADHRHRQVH